MVMGINPLEVGRMSLWHYLCAVRGWNKANSPNKPPPADVPDEMFDQIGTTMQWQPQTSNN